MVRNVVSWTSALQRRMMATDAKVVLINRTSYEDEGSITSEEALERLLRDNLGAEPEVVEVVVMRPAVGCEGWVRVEDDADEDEHEGSCNPGRERFCVD